MPLSRSSSEEKHPQPSTRKKSKVASALSSARNESENNDTYLGYELTNPKETAKQRDGSKPKIVGGVSGPLTDQEQEQIAEIIRREMFSTNSPMTQLKKIDTSQYRSEQILKLIQIDADLASKKDEGSDTASVNMRNRNFMQTTSLKSNQRVNESLNSSKIQQKTPQPVISKKIASKLKNDSSLMRGALELYQNESSHFPLQSTPSMTANE